MRGNDLIVKLSLRNQGSKKTWDRFSYHKRKPKIIMYLSSKLITKLTLIGLLIVLFSGRLAQAAPCEVNTVAEGANLFDATGAMVVTPNNKWLLVLDEVAGDVKVIEIARQQVLTTLDLQGLEPGGLAISADGGTLYVSGAFDGNVVVQDISTPEPSQWTTRTIWQIAGDFGAMQIDSKNTSQLLVTDRKVKGVQVLLTTDGSKQATLSTEYCRLPTALLQKDSLLFVACETSNKVAVFDLDSKEHRESISVGDAPVALLLHPSMPKLYVANLQGGSISVINTEDLKPIDELPKPDSVINNNVLKNPRNMMWLDNRIWILDKSAATLVRLDPDTDTKEIPKKFCTIASQPSYLATVILPQQRIVYTAHSNGVDYLSINIPKARRQPQVLMAGFDPILLDINDTKFKVVAVVEEGLAPVKTVSIEQNIFGGLGLKIVMNRVGSIPLVVEDNRKTQGIVYEIEYQMDGKYPAGSVATELLGLSTLSLFGDKQLQFHIRATDNDKVDEVGEQHSYPFWKYGSWPLIEKQDAGTAALLDNYSIRGPRRYHPQVIMAGFTPMLMDRGDTEVKVLAIVRRGSAEIKHVTLKSQASEFAVGMLKVSDLPNGDELYQGTVVTQRGTPIFAEDVEFSNVWNDMFQIEVIDTAEQRHQFPDFHVGDYPEF